MFNRLEITIVAIVGIVLGGWLIATAAIGPAQKGMLKPVVPTQEGLVRVELAEEVAEIGSKCLTLNKRLTVLAKELEKTINTISLEKPTKERVVLMVMLSELIAIKSHLAGGYLAITPLSFIMKEALPVQLDTARTWLYNFYGISMANSLFNLGDHASLSEHKELTKKVMAEFDNIGAMYASYFKFFKKVERASRELNKL